MLVVSAGLPMRWPDHGNDWRKIWKKNAGTQVECGGFKFSKNVVMQIGYSIDFKRSLCCDRGQVDNGTSEDIAC